MIRFFDAQLKKNKSDKKDKELSAKLQNEEDLLLKVFEIIAQGTVLFESIIVKTKSLIADAEKRKKDHAEEVEKEEDEEKKAKLEKRKDAADIYKDYHSYLYDLAKYHFTIFDFFHIYGSAFLTNKAN